MGGQFFISLLNPGIGLLLAGACLFLWRQRPSADYVGIAAAGYAVSALAFFIQDVGPVLPLEAQRIPANFCFMLAASLLTSAIIRRAGVSIPIWPMAATIVLTMAAFCWFLLVDPSQVVRVYVVSLAVGGLFALAAIRVHGARKTHLLDSLLMWLCVAVAATYILRPFLALGSNADYTDYDGFQRSTYWAAVQFGQAMFSTMLALALMVSVALELLGELRREAHTDKLSGLLNRRGFEEEAAVALARCAASGAPAAMLVADLDHFKTINDTYGHATGDAIIAAFGSAIRDTFASDVVAGRIGGEEFAVVMTQAEMGFAMALAEQLRQRLARRCRDLLPPGPRPSASIGLCMARPGDRLDDLFRNADEALYQAKHAGRDRVHLFNESFQRLVGARPA